MVGENPKRRNGLTRRPPGLVCQVFAIERNAPFLIRVLPHDEGIQQGSLFTLGVRFLYDDRFTRGISALGISRERVGFKCKSGPNQN